MSSNRSPIRRSTSTVHPSYTSFVEVDGYTEGGFGTLELTIDGTVFLRQ